MKIIPDMHILYIGAWLPSLSETFVYREIFALRDLGLNISVASVHKPSRGLGEERLELLANEAITLYSTQKLIIARNVIREFFIYPISSCSVIFRSITDAILEKDISSFKRIKVVWHSIAALALASRLRGMNITHIHSHMANVPTTIAMYCAQHLGISFSFTGHAVDIFSERTLLTSKLKRASFISCISQWHRDYYKSITVLSNDKLPIIRCGVDVIDFKPSTYKNHDSLLILAVGRLVEKKGFDILIQAIAQLKSQGINISCKIVGDGPQFQSLDSLRKSLNITNSVELIGARNNMEVKAIMKTSDLFVLPCVTISSGDRDGIPVVLMESMASGICTISGDLPAIRELIHHNDSGILLNDNDVTTLVQHIKSLIANPRRRFDLGMAGRRHVVEEFGSKLNAQRIRTNFLTVHNKIKVK